ncbi:ABC transporter substrate-binding protein [Acrocarpospora catenulata]|uniref:ABC transporter substrate-binding protein n=1 Tax=Acrocarpospora catenulata TaxID=2836182 RepID=UPI001BD9B959|nr:ABC transporter substrate-binding protein [Acrocarpospora catenulata]
MPPSRAALPAVLLLVLPLVTAACGSEGSGSGTGAAKPRTATTLTHAVEQEPDCWDPHVSAQDVTSFLQRPVYDSLVYQTPDGSLEPWLATRWQVSPDGKEYTFTLREDVVFHDGSKLDAAAVKANFDHITDPKTNSQYAAGLLGPYKGIKVSGPYEVKIEFERPYVPFLQAASTTALGIAAPASLAAGSDKLCAAGDGSVGSGPFKSGPYVRGQERTYLKNPAYAWAPKSAGHAGPPRLDSLKVRFITEDATRIGALTSGQVDTASAIPANQLTLVKDNPKLEVLDKQVPGAVNTFYLNTKSPLFSDRRVRQAFQRAIDIDTIVKSVFQGLYPRAWSVLSPTTPASYDPTLEGTWPPDPALAAKLLDEAGWTGRDAEGYRTKDGKRLTVVAPIYGKPSTFSQAVQGDLKKSGIYLQLAASTDAIEVGSRLDEGRYDVVELSWARGDGDILSHFFFSDQTSKNSGHNFAQVADPEMDQWLTAAQTAQDPAERAANYAKAQRWAIDQAAVVPTYIDTQNVGFSTRVHDLRLGISAHPEFYAAWVEAP